MMLLWVGELICTHIVLFLGPVALGAGISRAISMKLCDFGHFVFFKFFKSDGLWAHFKGCSDGGTC